MQILAFLVVFLAIWVVLNAWILPKFGIKT